MRKVAQLTMGQSQKCDKGDSYEALLVLVFLAVGSFSFFLTIGLNTIRVDYKGNIMSVC